MAVAGTSSVRAQCRRFDSDGSWSTWYDEAEEIPVIERSETLTRVEKKK